MNVLIINASPRRKGITSTLLSEIKTTINSAYKVEEVVRIQTLDIKPCTGCLKCRPDKTCILPRDGAHILAEKIKESDILIIGTPVYWGNMPGTLKTVLKSGGVKIMSVLNVPDSYNFEKKRSYYLNKVKKLAVSI